jgi:hypothetical protein
MPGTEAEAAALLDRYLDLESSVAEATARKAAV